MNKASKLPDCVGYNNVLDPGIELKTCLREPQRRNPSRPMVSPSNAKK